MGTDVEVGITESIANIYIFNEERGAWVQKDFKDFIFDNSNIIFDFRGELEDFLWRISQWIFFWLQRDFLCFSAPRWRIYSGIFSYFILDAINCTMFKNNPTIVQPPICNIIFNQLRLRILKETKIFQTFHC